jgi:transposase
LALEQQYRSCPDATASRHLQTIWLLAKGHDIAEVAATVSYARRWVERLLARDNAQGLQALGDLRRQNGTSPSVLKPDLLDKLKDRLREPPPDGGLWTSPKGAAWMAAELGLTRVAPQRGCVARIGGMGAWTPTPSRVRRCGHRSGVPAPAYG